ncbi:hypothetical protein H920_07930 [Fukomys damarensis]|uniref:Uncharacterized protein n=1 Tax=Fukomys damarensis TaxID=885580 RepID=A0A091DKA8_FUKDA|nr:hypothetical protein H920_07930 [Fukomys damarensis]
MIAAEIMEIHRIRGLSPSCCGSSPLNITSTPPADASSPGGKKILNGGTPDIPSSGLLPVQVQENPGYPYSVSTSILGENPHIGIDMVDNDQGSSSPSNNEATMAVIMSILEADAAAACEFLDIVELLLQSGADPALRDQDGCMPEEVTGCKAVSLVLQQHMATKA